MQKLPNYSLTLKADGGVLLACVTAAEVTTQMVVDYTNRISAKLRSAGLFKMLFVRRCPTLNNPRDAMMTAYMLRNSLLGRLKLAVVDEYGNTRASTAESDRAAKAAGFEAKSFPNMTEAREWLDSSE